MRSLGKYDLAAIAVGGALGATVRWGVTRLTVESDGGWFSYAPNDSVIPGEESLLAELNRATIVSSTSLPYETLAVNLVGCLLLGVFALLLARSTTLSRRALLAAATGFCGSLTTFSTFAVEMATRLRDSPVMTDGIALSTLGGQPSASAAASSVIYLAASVLGGAFAFWLGRVIARNAAERGLV